MITTLLNLVTASSLAAPRAYIDPNTGGMLFQILAVLLASVSAILFFFSRQIKAAWARFRRGVRKEEPPQEPQEK
jgi:hypothetical protein